jgi:hypothetical protein
MKKLIFILNYLIFNSFISCTKPEDIVVVNNNNTNDATEKLLDLVQKQTFKYFYDYSHPASGMARERFNSGNTVTTGGSGFGVAAIPVAIERKFITRNQGYLQLKKIVDFLSTADRFHGAWAHWIDGNTGKVIPFSANDDGADLVETAFMIQGLLIAQQYFINGSMDEKALCDRIQKLYEEVEWTWFQQNSQNVLYWHWSPNYGWVKNVKLQGWNETLIVYVLAASSPTYPIKKIVYDSGFAKNGAIKNGKQYYGITLPLGNDYGGPLFFAHYSFLGLDPRTLRDQYANYWDQNMAQAMINYQYCITNPKNYVGYSKDCWGLTASDTDNGYKASSPTNDNGVIAPTAAISSIPYTPKQSLAAMNYFAYTLGTKLMGDYGFKDAFNLTNNWFATSYLAIDQGPIIVMIENYRTGLCWNLFMKNEDIKHGLNNLGFTW